MSGAGSPHAAVAHRTAVTPPQRRRNYVPNSRSSDSLPELDELLPSRIDSRLRTGSRAATLPQNAAAGFQSTATLLKYNLLSLQQEKEKSESPVKQKAKKKANAKSREGEDAGTKRNTTKERANKSKGNAGEQKRKSAKRKSEEVTVGPTEHQCEVVQTVKTTEKTTGDEAQHKPLSESARKRRKLDGRESDLGEPTRQTSTSPEVARKKRTAKNSEHFQGNAEITPAIDVPNTSEKGLSTNSKDEQATKGSPEATKEASGLVDIFKVPSSPRTGSPEGLKLDFSQLRHNFSYDGAKSTSTSPDRGIQPVTVLKPGRKIDLVPDLRPQGLTVIIEQPGSAVFVAAETHPSVEKLSPTRLLPQSEKEIRKKSPKKGPMSITARSIARYAQVEPVEPETPAVVSPHFAPIFCHPQEDAMSDPAIANGRGAKRAKPRKPRQSKGKESGKAKETKSKKASAKAKKVAFIAPPKLVSPKQHNAKLKRQDLLFGTSSQLRQDLSPQYVREIRQALQESEVDAQEPDERGSSPISLQFTEAVRRTRRKMWNESVNTGMDSGWQDISDIMGDNSPVLLNEEQNQDDPLHAEASQDAVTPDLPAQEAHHGLLPRDSSPVPSNGFWLSKHPVTLSEPRITAISVVPEAINISSSPRFSVSPPRVALRTMSTNTKSPTKKSQESKSKTAAVGTKSPKSRSRKDGQNDNLSSPAKPRGRPRKAATASSPVAQTPRKRGRPAKIQVAPDDNDGFQHIDDIEDSEPDHTPSPPRRRGSPATANSQPLPLSTTTTTEKATNGRHVNTAILNAQHARWPQVKKKLFPEITATIQSAPPTGDIKRPSWNEKILLYDPIVLEDLTAWLNSQGLRVEGKDGVLVEVSCWMVQSWCEGNGVCCLWREGLRGGVRVRY